MDADLEPDVPVIKSPCPPGCTKCIDACPTSAIIKPYTIRMDRCISYLTYGASLPIEHNLEEKMGSWIYGCDICQEVCPLNKNSWTGKEKIDYLEAVAHLLVPASLAEMDIKTYQNIIQPLFYYIYT